jgi:hypothetical protein
LANPICCLLRPGSLAPHTPYRHARVAGLTHQRVGEGAGRSSSSSRATKVSVLTPATEVSVRGVSDEDIHTVDTTVAPTATLPHVSQF